MGICLIIKSGGGVDTSSATATADKILSGYTVYVNDNKIIGSMTSVGKQTASGLNAGGSKTISAGWHDGTGSVTTNSLSSQTDGTSIAAGDVLSGCTYWSSGAKATGTMTSRGTKTWTLGANGTQTIESGWHDGKGTVKQSIGVDNNECWRTPSTAQQQVCWSGTYYSKNRGCYGASTLTAANIKKDITIFGVKGTWQGWVDSTVWIIKDGNPGSGFTVSVTTPGGIADGYTSYKSSWGTYVLAGYDGNTEGHGRLSISGLSSLNIGWETYWSGSSNNYPYKALFHIDFIYHSQKTGPWWNQLHAYVSPMSTEIHDASSSKYGNWAWVKVNRTTGVAPKSWDSTNQGTIDFYIWVSKIVKNFPSTLSTVQLWFKMWYCESGVEWWQVRNLWVERY